MLTTQEGSDRALDPRKKFRIRQTDSDSTNPYQIHWIVHNANKVSSILPTFTKLKLCWYFNLKKNKLLRIAPRGHLSDVVGGWIYNLYNQHHITHTQACCRVGVTNWALQNPPDIRMAADLSVNTVECKGLCYFANFSITVIRLDTGYYTRITG